MSSGADDLDRLRATAVADARRSMAANTELSAVMEETMAVAGELVAAMERGESVAESMRTNAASVARMSATRAIRAYESARHRSRLSLIAVAVAEGCSDAELCELWQMSAEMVRRAKREQAALDRTGTGGSGADGVPVAGAPEVHRASGEFGP